MNHKVVQAKRLRDLAEEHGLSQGVRDQGSESYPPGMTRRMPSGMTSSVYKHIGIGFWRSVDSLLLF